MPIRALIIDDEALARERLRNLLEGDSRVTVAGEASNGASALEQIARHQPDLLFLDIQMPEKTGIEVASELHASGQPLPAIVFVTAYDAFALKAFDLHAADYLLKPFDRARFATALDKALAALQQRDASDMPQKLAALLAELQPKPAKPAAYLSRLSVKNDGRIRIVPTQDIDWIAAANNYVEIHTAGGTHLMRETLSQIESQLDPALFLRISRSAIVAIDRIREIQPLFHGEHAVLLANGAKLTATRSYRDALKPLLGK